MMIQDLYATSVYQRRDEYERRTGKSCPIYDPSKPQKYWEDPGLKLGRKIGQAMLYEYGLVRTEAGDWTIGPFVVPVAEAVRVNIPPDQPSPAGANPDVVPVPLTRGLLPGEKIRLGFGGIPVLTTAAEEQTQQQASGHFTAADRAVLVEIRDKLREIAKILGA